MSKPVNHDTTLLIKLPSDLKGAFKGLCDAKGVTISEELRRYMADAVVDATKGMTTTTVPDNVTPKSVPIKKRSKLDNPIRCDKTTDMFPTETPQNEPQATKHNRVVLGVQNGTKTANNANKIGRKTKRKKRKR